MIFDCYLLTKNQEKGFKILNEAFQQNKKAVDIFLDQYIKYECEKPLMYHFLKPSELQFRPVGNGWSGKTVYEWIDTLYQLDQRNPYVKDTLDYLDSYLSIDDLMKIIEALAE